MKKITKFLIFLSLVGSVVSCTSISYIPKVSLDVSPQLIHKSARVEKFKDTSPVKDKKMPYLGVSVTNNELLSNELDIEVTNTIVSDFSTNGVFKKVSRNVENPDFIIKGEIKKFYGKSQFNTFAKISMFMGTASLIGLFATNKSLFFLGMLPELSWYAGVPLAKNTSEVEIALSLYDANNNLINTYTGKASALTPSSLYDNKASSIQTMTNKTFSEAIRQIREQIVRDIDKLNQ